VRSKTQLAFIALFFSISLFAQSTHKVDGLWTGYLSQDQGGFKNKYNVKFELKEKEGKISGICFILEGNLTSKMEVEGYWKSKTELVLNDIRLMDHKEPDNIDWCIKQYNMVFKKSKNNLLIEGDWKGKTKTAECIPGKIFLSRPKLRA
jgi:hypothetical protein